MKKTIYISMMAVLSLIACSKLAEERVPDVAPYGEAREVTFVAANTLASDTKAVFADGEGFSWEAADLTNFSVSLGGGNVKSTGGSIIDVAGDTYGYAQITAPVANGTAYVGFPYNEAGAGIFDLGANQTVTAGSFKDFKLASDAVSVTSETTAADVKFHLVGHLLRFLVYASEGSTESIQKITVSADKTIAGTYTYNFAAKSGSVTAGAATEVKAVLTNPVDLTGITDSKNTTTVFVPIVPVDDGLFVYKVYTNLNIYTFTSTEAKDRAEGDLTEVKLNLSNAKAVSTAKEDVSWFFRVASDYGIGVSASSLTVGSSASATDAGFFLAKIGTANPGNYTTHELYNSFRYEAVDGEDSPVDWLSFSKTGDNRVNVAYAANESELPRSATLKVYYNGDVTSYKDFYSDGNAVNPATDPIFSMPVTQNGVPAVHTIEFKFLTSDEDPSTPVTSTYNIPGTYSHATRGRFQTFVDGDKVTSGSNEVVQALRFQIDDASPVADANNGWLRAYRYEYRDMNFEVQALDGSKRQAVLKVYLSGDFYDTYTVTSDGNPIADPSTPLFTTTVKQAHQVVYDFYSEEWATGKFGLEGGISKAAGSFNTGGLFRVRINGGGNTAGDWDADYLTNFSLRAVDTTTSAEVSWVKNVRIYPDSNERKLQFDLEENTTGASRTARVYVYANDKGDYVVIGRVRQSDNSTLYFSSVAEPNDRYVYTFEVTQPGA